MNLEQCIRNLLAALNRIEQSELVFQRLVQELTQALPIDRCVLWRLEAERFVVLVEASPDPDPDPGQTSPGLPDLRGLGRPGSEAYQRLCQNQILQALPPELMDYAGFLGVPILAGEELVGLLGLYRRQEPLLNQPLPMTLLQQLAALIGIAFTQARLLSPRQVEPESCFQSQLLNAVEQAVIATDLKGQITYWNCAATKLYGWSAAEVMGRDILQVAVLEDAQVQAAKSVARLQRGESWSGEFWLRRRDGTAFPAIVTNSPVYDHQALVVGVLRLSTDISDRKRAEEALIQARILEAINRELEQEIAERRRVGAALRQSEALLSTVLDSARAAIVRVRFLADRTCRVIYGSSAIESVFGYSAQEFTADENLWFSRVLPEDLETVINPSLADVFAEHSYVMEFRFRHKDETLCWILQTCVSQKAQDAEDGWIVTCVATDITERKQAEGLKQANWELRQTNANLSRLEKLKSELVATVSHEIRTPVTTVCTAISALGTIICQASPEQSRLLNIANREARRLTHLVNSLLDFSKLDSGTYRWRQEPTNLRAVVLQAIESTAIVFESRPVYLRRSVAKHPLQVLGDCERLVQLVVNLLDNAAKFSPPQSQVWLKLSRQGQRAVMTVRDQGPGIPAEHQTEIFDLLTQRQEPNDQRPQGIGLGLYLCRQIAQHHGGSLTVESKPGRGSSFRLVLPLIAAA